MTAAPQPLRIALDFVNAWLFDLDGSFILVDSGLSMHRERLDAALRAAGCEPGRLALHILTHPDSDHAGNSAWLREAWGAKVAIHEKDAPALASGIMPRRRAIGSLSWIVGLSQLVPRKPGLGCTADILLEDGQSLEAWGLDARVYHLPGHTPGSIGILTVPGATATKDFIAGDLVANWHRPGPGLLASDLEAYRASLDRARALVPADGWVYPGHGAPFPASGLAGIKL